MATGTVPAAVPGPPDQPHQAPTAGEQTKSLLASMVAAVEPARPTFDLAPTGADSTTTTAVDGALDRSAPGVSSASFRSTAEQAAKGKDPAGTRHKRSIWKEMWLAAATRWAKGGGAAKKRLDLAKARAQAHQVKENRTTTVTKSGGLPVRNSGGSGAGSDKGSGKGGGNSPKNGSLNSSGFRSDGAGRSGSGGSSGGRGSGGSGNSGSGSAGRGSKGSGAHRDAGPHKDRSGAHRNSAGTGAEKNSTGGEKNKTDSRHAAGKDSGRPSPAGPGGKPGKQGPAGKSNSGSAAAGTGSDAKEPGGKHDLAKHPKNPKNPRNPKDSKGSKGLAGKDNTAAHTTGRQQPPAEKTPLEKSRETGHADGTKARRVVDHVKAYSDGARDGWRDEKTKNAKEHHRLDKAHTTHQPKNDRPQGAIITEKGDDGVTTDVKPLTVTTIDANTLTLGTDGARTTVGRRELRNFKQYERKLEAKTDILHKIAEACVQLEKEAADEAKDCQNLLEQAKSVNGGDKLVSQLAKLTDAAKNQASEAAELAQRARKAAEMCKVVLTNIQTRYAPLYKAVVDSDETKPAELRFYNDKGTYAPAAA